MDDHTLYKQNLEFSADSVEWCPHEPNQHVFVCANYYLDKENEQQIRKGRILLYSINPNTGLALVKTIETDGILDQKWCHNQIQGYSYLAVATSHSSLELYQLINNTNILDLKFITKLKFESDEEDLLILSLDWSTGKFCSETPEIVCSDSKGCIHLVQFDGKNLTLINSSNKIHEFEAWIAAFYYWDPNIYFSGGDDMLFCKYDKRTGVDPISKNRKVFEAGVTCMHSNKLNEFILATGSYDTYLRLWDIRNMKAPTDSIETPGTMWRIKWDPFESKQMLIACMLGGVHIVDNSDSLKIIHSYEEHKNIAYGADWSYLLLEKTKKFNENASRIIGSCSFYDKLLCVSVIE